MDKISVKGMTFTDEYGRERIFNGVNICDKGRWNGSKREYLTKWDDDRLEKLAENGVNLVRLGITWDAVEPRPGEYNDEYLDALLALTDRCAEKGMYVYIDMHQDLYSGFGDLPGDGAPAWACKTKGMKVHKPLLVWAEGYFFKSATGTAFDSFWENKMVKGKGLQDYYGDMWAHIADKFKNHPALFGYDMMNEPYPGTIGSKIFAKIVGGVIKTTLFDRRLSKIELIKTALSGTPERVLDLYTGDLLRSITKSCDGLIEDFDKNRYSPFLNKTSSAIRRVTDSGILFIDNNYYSNLGIPSATPKITVDNKPDHKQCFAPHAYDFGVDTPLYRYASNSRIEAIFREHRRAQERLGLPVVVGEWGGGCDGSDWLYHIEFLLDLFDSFKWSFTYWEHTAYLGNEALKKTLKRPYPMAVCGEIISYKHDRQNKTFTLNWRQDRDYPVETEIFMPFEIENVETACKYEKIGDVMKIWGNMGENSIVVKML